MSCGSRGLLSLKYDVWTSNVVSYDESTGAVINNADDNSINTEPFRYVSPINGQTYEGTDGYQALFVDELRSGLSGERPLRRLELTFGTHLFQPPKRVPGVFASNPFYLASATTAKVTGFSNPNCAGPGVPSGQQGVQINFTGALFQPPALRLSQNGNSYLKHTPWDSSDFDSAARLIEPMKNITIYSAYRQVLPTWLIGDLDPETTETEISIGSDVEATLFPLVNGSGIGGGAKKTLAFTDRAVANDSWKIVIDEFDSTNAVFFQNLDLMLNSEIGSSDSEYLTDIQLWIGWAYK